MNKKQEKSLKFKISMYKKCVPDFDLTDMRRYIEHTWNMPLSLSMMLTLDEDAFEKYRSGAAYAEADDLQALIKVRHMVRNQIVGNPVEFTEEERLRFRFDIEVTGGISGCLITCPENRDRFIRAITALLGCDYVVSQRTYRYIYRRLNLAIADEIARRNSLNANLPHNLQLPI